MAKSTKSYEERMLEMEKREQESLEKAKRYAAQKKELLKRKKTEESKKRTHRLCQIGGAVESVLGAPIEEEDIPKLIVFLKRQEANGRFFSKAMQKETNNDTDKCCYCHLFWRINQKSTVSKSSIAFRTFAGRICWN